MWLSKTDTKFTFIAGKLTNDSMLFEIIKNGLKIP